MLEFKRIQPKSISFALRFGNFVKKCWSAKPLLMWRCWSEKHGKHSTGHTKVDKRVQCFTSVQNAVKINERSWQYQKRTSRKAETGRGR